MEGKKSTASQQVQSTLTMASTGAITPNCRTAPRGPNSATGTNAAARTMPDNHQQAKWPAPAATMAIGSPPRTQYRTIRNFMVLSLLFFLDASFFVEHRLRVRIWSSPEDTHSSGGRFPAPVCPTLALLPRSQSIAREVPECRRSARPKEISEG